MSRANEIVTTKFIALLQSVHENAHLNGRYPLGGQAYLFVVYVKLYSNKYPYFHSYKEY